MRLKLIQLSLALALGWHVANNAQAQPITPVFEHLFTAQVSPLPILKAQGAATLEGDRFDGTSPMDSYGGFARYDETRLLLGIRENGINEAAPGHDAALAAAYPDRSLQWIKAETGAPLGTALTMGLRPVPLDADFLAKGGTDIDFYFNFGVAEDGVVFVGYKNKILRYAPSGQGGFSAPSVAYTHADDGSANWQQWRWESIRVKGAGIDTVILAGGKTWRPNQGFHRITTTDGTTFSKADLTQDVAAGGGASSIISGRVPGEPDTDWVYVTLFPGSSNGIDSRFNRRTGDPENFLPFANDGTFAAARDPNADPESDYVSEFISDVDGDATLGYVVAYSTPSWNSKGVGRTPTRPGFLAVHAHDGSVLGSHTLAVTEDDEILGDPQSETASSQFHGALGGVEVNVLPGQKAGQAELLWYSGIYGYGRYLVGVSAAAPETSTLSVRRAANGVDITWEGGGTLESAAQINGPWSAVAGAQSPYTALTSEAAQYYRLRQ